MSKKCNCGVPLAECHPDCPHHDRPPQASDWMPIPAQHHELKILPFFFRAVVAGDKRFEIRNTADREFRRGDTVTLKEWFPESGYTGREFKAQVTYVTSYEQKDGFVVFGFRGMDGAP